ncbi:hypothetical protein B5K08_16170 [Rhizobium leguminosarum bv. trifolii]|uniref:DUF930 domain-containing protein n=1 Tax=Rhizobium leguminosarum bv. trifolii TaxID=386 RepID=A0A3E1BGW7_RHILT|nr:DUF930 domain-containing protein [Rhizobium leguminosarum]RFB91826.1 hypothetical protein B5K08_16170 [Rhizobium leguminosarum bv. trifolii]RFB92343.1 hypothetical protein B5K10_16165 [Rhizobium leguminosarum bv. trifolii]
MELAAGKWDGGMGRGAAASFGLHAAAILLLLLLWPKAEPPMPLPDDGLSVEIVPQPVGPPTTPEPVRAPSPAPAKAEAAAPQAERPVANNAPAAAMPLVTPIAPPAPKPAEFVAASRLFSDNVLADPRSRRAREALRGLAGSERNLQLCDLEALAQVRRARPDMRPDLLAPYAMAPEKISGNSVEVSGGALRSNRAWYNIQFKCGLDAGSGKVISFAFLVGDAIPQAEWQAHDLVADDGAADQ